MSFVDDIEEGEEGTSKEEVFPGNPFDAEKREGHPSEVAPEISKERKPERHLPRKSTEDFFSMLYGGFGFMLVQSGADIPVGRVLQFQAPLAGKKIDELLMGTWIDNLLQPIVSQTEKAEGLGALIALPVLIAIYERNPAVGPQLEMIVRKVVEVHAVEMAPILKKQHREMKKAASAFEDIQEIFADDPQFAADPIGAIIGSFFAGLGAPEAEEPTEGTTDGL